jgi:hypothetical protein
MYKVSYFIAILCAACLISCGGGSPRGIVDEYYTQLKKGNYERVAEIAIDHFWKSERLDKAVKKGDGNDRQETIRFLAAILKEKGKDHMPKDFAITDVTTENGETLVKVKEIHSDYENTYVYKFVKEDGKWVAIEKVLSN